MLLFQAFVLTMGLYERFCNWYNGNPANDTDPPHTRSVAPHNQPGILSLMLMCHPLPEEHSVFH